MKNAIMKWIAAVLLLGALASLLSGCLFRKRVVDGPGMVNYPGMLLEVLLGDWRSKGEESYCLTFWSDGTVSLSENGILLLDKAALTLYIDHMDTDAYSELGIKPSVFTDEAGNSMEIAKASYENGTVTLELTASDGTQSVVAFFYAPELLDGPGMISYGKVLNDAIEGCWSSADGRFTMGFLDNRADFTVEGTQYATQDDGDFIEHSREAEADLTKRCQMYPTGNYMGDAEEPPFTISEMWYEAEHIFMRISWLDGTVENVTLHKQENAGAEGK